MPADELLVGCCLMTAGRLADSESRGERLRSRWPKLLQVVIVGVGAVLDQGMELAGAELHARLK